MFSGIRHAYAINGDGYGLPLKDEAISKAIEDEALAWVHLDGNDPDARVWLESEITYLDDLIVEALLEKETRPRIIEFESGALMILRGVNLNENAEPEDMISIRLWVDANRIISVQYRQLKAIEDMCAHFQVGTGPKNSGDFVTILSSGLFDRMEPVFGELDESLDTVEEEVMEEPDKELRSSIIDIRRQAIIFRRYISPQRDVMMHLRTSNLPWLEAGHKRNLQENLDRVTRYVEDLDAIRERAQVVKDELSNALADRMNKNMYMLTILSAVFLPLGFLTGLLGINVGGIPGADNSGAFFIFCGILMVIVLGQVVLFKWLKWF